MRRRMAYNCKTSVVDAPREGRDISGSGASLCSFFLIASEMYVCIILYFVARNRALGNCLVQFYPSKQAIWHHAKRILSRPVGADSRFTEEEKEQLAQLVSYSELTVRSVRRVCFILAVLVHSGKNSRQELYSHRQPSGPPSR